MLKQDAVSVEEERLREQIQSLTETQRRDFYEQVKKQIRDPDTYAALNWFFVAGLHHFYLGKWFHGLADLLIFALGAGFMVTGLFWIGLALIVFISLWEFWALFRSQIIIQDWNNRLYRRLLNQIENQSAS